MRSFQYFVLALLTSAAFGQSAGPTLTVGAKPSFEVADVHSSPHATVARMSGPFFGDGRYEIHYATMVDLIQTAYSVDADRVYGGPSWLEYDRFEVIAKAPAGSNPQSRKLMLQSLLADRFKLVLKSDSKPMSAYKMTAGKSRLQEPSGSGETGCNFKVESQPPQPQPQPGGGPPPSIALPTLSYTCHNTTLATFATALPSIPGAAGYFDNKPVVVDPSESQASWDFSVKYTPKVNLPPGVNITITGENMPLFEALDKQLGLKIELANIPMPVMNVDAAEKPGPNSPDVAKSFPPPPTEFDVAELKPSPPGTGDGKGGGQQPEIKNGRLIIPGINLKGLIQAAWDLSGDDTLIGAPKWLDTARYDLIAKAPAGVAIGDLSFQSSKSMPINIDALRPMLRSLMADRFKLVVHTEQRPMSAYTLVAVKPKMQKADPTTRTKWSDAPAADSNNSKDAKNTLGRLVTCQNMTMAQFAQLLPEIAPGYIRTDVLDSTGLDGGWTFTVSFSPAGALQGGGRGGDGPPGAGDGTAAADPTGALSLLDALQKQVGLKLEMTKRPMPVLVIDHIEPKPTDN